MWVRGNKLLSMDLPLYMNITTECKEESIVVEKSAVVQENFLVSLCGSYNHFIVIKVSYIVLVLYIV